jgi:hypothetical protein
MAGTKIARTGNCILASGVYHAKNGILLNILNSSRQCINVHLLERRFVDFTNKEYARKKRAIRKNARPSSSFSPKTSNFIDFFYTFLAG